MTTHGQTTATIQKGAEKRGGHPTAKILTNNACQKKSNQKQIILNSFTCLLPARGRWMPHP